MHTGKYVLTQLMDLIHPEVFSRCVRAHDGDKDVESFSCRDQFLAMVFAQMTSCHGLREIELSLRSHAEKLYHAGFRGQISRNTLSAANQSRSSKIFSDLAMKLVSRARPMYANDIFDSDLKQNIYAFDSTTIDLCLSLFPWADFRETKAAVKLHTLLDLRGSIPVFIGITDGKTTDNKMLDELVLEPGAFYAIDRGYLDLKRLCRIQEAKAFFVIRSKSNLKLTRLKSLPVEENSNVRSDKIVRFKHAKSFGDFPHYLRRVRIFDEDQKRFLVLLTNNFDLPSKTIALIYKHRWAIENFFKWIKQNLRVKHFFGNSRNAVETQIWIAVCFYLLLAILKKLLDLPYSITEIHQILCSHVFSQDPMPQIFAKIKSQETITSENNQLMLNLL